jgi:hypothetical protein
MTSDGQAQTAADAPLPDDAEARKADDAGDDDAPEGAGG